MAFAKACSTSTKVVSNKNIQTFFLLTLGVQNFVLTNPRDAQALDKEFLVKCISGNSRKKSPNPMASRNCLHLVKLEHWTSEGA